MSKRRTSSSPPLGAAEASRLRVVLDRVVDGADRARQLANDPISAVHRYTRPHDQELAGAFASVLAFGRVAAFRPVVHAILDTADLVGGPRAFVEAAQAPDVTRPLLHLRYRWMSGTDLAVFARALGRVVRENGSLEAVFVDGPARSSRIASGVDALRAAVLADTGAADWRAVSRGVRYMLPHPHSGSACKRWCMFLRWMVRPPHPSSVAGLDVGIWSGDPARLVMPLDTHVQRIGQLVGLTHRRDASWRTALDLTDNLARIAPGDPLRYDFALAHLGISGGCTGRYAADVCGACGLRSVCRVAHNVERSIG